MYFMFDVCFDGESDVVTSFPRVVGMECVRMYFYLVCIVESMTVQQNNVGVVFSIHVAELIAAVECPMQNIMLDDSETLHGREGRIHGCCCCLSGG